MKYAQHIFQGDLNEFRLSDYFKDSYDWVLVFGNRFLLENPENQLIISNQFSGSVISGCSTSGEFSGSEVDAPTISITAISFERTKILQNLFKLIISLHQKMLGKH
jgi:hypothetical protein